MELLKSAVPLPSLVVLLAVVGKVEVLYATPLAIMALPPAVIPLPPLAAVLLVTADAAAVVLIVGRPASVVALDVGDEVKR